MDKVFDIPYGPCQGSTHRKFQGIQVKFNYSTKPLIYTLSDNFQKLRYDLVYNVQGVDLSCNERWRICTEYARDSLPLIVGRFYVETYFNDDTKRQVSQFANSIKKSFVDVLKEQDWMDETTKKAALDKADKLTEQMTRVKYEYFQIDGVV